MTVDCRENYRRNDYIHHSLFMNMNVFSFWEIASYFTLHWIFKISLELKIKNPNLSFPRNVLKFEQDGDDICRFCETQGSVDSSTHIIEDCCRFNSSRQRIFGKSQLNLRDEELDTNDILRFITENETIKLRLTVWTNTEAEATDIINERELQAALSYSQRINNHNHNIDNNDNNIVGY